MEQQKPKYPNEKILERDTDGQPIVGKYDYNASDKVKEEVFEVFDQMASETQEEAVIPLTEEEERSAQNVAVVKASAWIKEHPNYTMDQLSKAKAEFLEEARNSFRTARAKNTDTNGNH